MTSPESPDPLDGLPNPLPSPSLVREYVRVMAAKVLYRERDERAARREARRRETPQWRESPRGRLEAERQRELDRLTEDNAEDVRARLKELNRELKALVGPYSMNPDPDVRFARSMKRLAQAAWDEAVARDEGLARLWWAAFCGANPELVETIRRLGPPHEEMLSMLLGQEMLVRAAPHDPECMNLRARISRILGKDPGQVSP